MIPPDRAAARAAGALAIRGGMREPRPPPYVYAMAQILHRPRRRGPPRFRHAAGALPACPPPAQTDEVGLVVDDRGEWSSDPFGDPGDPDPKLRGGVGAVIRRRRCRAAGVVVATDPAVAIAI